MNNYLFFNDSNFQVTFGKGKLAQKDEMYLEKASSGNIEVIEFIGRKPDGIALQEYFLQGKYYISINIRQILKNVIDNKQGKLGLDLGIKDFLTTSTGEHIPNPGHLKKYENK